MTPQYNYIIEHPDLSVSNFMENSIGLKKFFLSVSDRNLQWSLMQSICKPANPEGFQKITGSDYHILSIEFIFKKSEYPDELWNCTAHLGLHFF